jgi:hypothetical protein
MKLVEGSWMVVAKWRRESEQAQGEGIEGKNVGGLAECTGSGR